MASPYGLLGEKNFQYKTIGSITFLAEFQFHPFAFFAKPARDSNLELLNKLIARDLKSSNLTTRLIPAADLTE